MKFLLIAKSKYSSMLDIEDVFNSEIDALASFYHNDFNFEIKELNEEEFFEYQTNKLLEQIPDEFRTALSYYAYRMGHSSGKEEVLIILKDIIFDLKESIEKYGSNQFEKGKNSILKNL